MQDYQPLGQEAHSLAGEAPSKVPFAFFQWGEIYRTANRIASPSHQTHSRRKGPLPHPERPTLLWAQGQQVHVYFSTSPMDWLGLLSEPFSHLPCSVSTPTPEDPKTHSWLASFAN